MTAVIFIDDGGKTLLGRMYQSGVQLVATGLPMKAVIEKIESKEARHAAVETAKAGIVAAKAMIEATKVAAATEQLNLSFTRIVSPIDGIAGIARADWQSGQCHWRQPDNNFYG